MGHRRRRFLAGVVIATAVPILSLGAMPAAWAVEGGPEPVPDGSISDTFETPLPRGVADSLQRASGQVEVTVRLDQPAIAEVVADGALAEGDVPAEPVQQETRDVVATQQDGFLAEAANLGASEIGRTQLAANVVVVSVDAAQLQTLAAIDGVVSVNPLNRYEKHELPQDTASGSLSQAIDYVQARPLHDAGIDGAGVRVAVLDSGIDFTHRNLGGPGTPEVVEECFAGADADVTGVCAEFFGPDAPKVKGGYDFVGDVWPNGDVIPDSNPIDSGPEGGHGTHVADIIAGRSADGAHQGIAPGAELYGVKVCSAVSTSCNGVAILQGLDWSLDPNGDGDISDAVDVVNLSLGSSYGQDQDDSSLAADNLVRAGIVVVASAGNSADRPFIVGSPSSAPGVISVAQTALPDDLQWVLDPSSGDAISNAVHQAWSPVPEGVISAPLVRPGDDGGVGCSNEAFAGFPEGSIALIQRGVCNVSDKAVFAQAAGAVAVVIFNNAPGDPPSFSFGSAEPVVVPTFTISQAAGQALVAALGAGEVTVTIDPASAIPLTNTMVGTSSRGFTVTGLRAKPDIGAPGAWLSAETQTGTEVTNFGGTSGAAPVVSGVAALVLQRHPDATPAQVKARLLNGADSSNRTPTADGFIATPISRVGAGEVRALPAADAVGVLATAGTGGNVGLGIPSVTRSERFTVDLTLTNTSNERKRYDMAAAFRDETDAASRAVDLQISPRNVTVAAGQSKKVSVRVTIDGARLQDWPFDSAGAIGDGSALNGPEFDGWITATSGDEELHVGWTVLPRKAAEVTAPKSVKLDRRGEADLTLKNDSRVGTGGVEMFALTGTSERQPKPAEGDPGTPGSNAARIDLAATGVRTVDDVVQFAVATYDRRTVLTYPAEFDVYVDVDEDGTDDYVVYNAEAGGFGLTGQSVVYVLDLATNAASAFYYTDGGFDSSTQILTAPLAALGLEAGQTFSYTVLAIDNYFTGAVTDSIEGQRFTVGGEKYLVPATTEVGPRDRVTLDVTANPAAGESTQTGLLLLNRSAAKDDFSLVEVRG